MTNGWGDGPRTTPTVADGKVYALGGKGNLVCADARSGKKIWDVHMVKDLEGKVPGWGYTESVLVDQGRVICTPGGKGRALTALDAKTGKILWRSKEFTEPAQYSSPIVINHGGKRQYVQLVMKKLVGVDAKNGNLVWSSDWPGKVMRLFPLLFIVTDMSIFPLAMELDVSSLNLHHKEPKMFMTTRS